MYLINENENYNSLLLKYCYNVHINYNKCVLFPEYQEENYYYVTGVFL